MSEESAHFSYLLRLHSGPHEGYTHEDQRSHSMAPVADAGTGTQVRHFTK